MINLDQFRAMGIASKADIETLDSYEANLPEYRENAYTYIPIPSADKYYHVVDDELRDIDEEQYFPPDITMMTAFERLQNYPFLLHDRLMSFKQATEGSDREFVPDGEKTFTIEEESYSASEIINQADSKEIPRDVVGTVKNLAEDRYYIITLADTNKRRARELFYHAISGFEIQLAYQIKAEYPNSLIEDVDENEIERWYRAKIDELEIHIAEYMHLSTLLTVGGKDENIRERFGFTSRSKWKDNLGGLNSLRHKIMHPTRALVHNRDSLKKEVDRVHRVRKALDQLDGDQVQPDYPRPADS